MAALTRLKRSDHILPVPLHDADDLARRQNVTTPFPLLVVVNVVIVFVVALVVRRRETVDLAPPLVSREKLDGDKISIDGPVAKRPSRDQDVLALYLLGVRGDAEIEQNVISGQW